MQAIHRSDHLRSLIFGAGFASLGLIVGGLLTLITGVVLARWLKPEEFGIYSIAVVVVTLFGGLGAAGMDTAVARFVSFYTGTGTGELIAPVIRFGISSAAICSLLMGWLTYFALHSGSILPQRLAALRPLSIYISIAVPICALLLVLQHTILGLGRLKTRIVIEKLIQPFCRLAFPFVIVLLVGGGRLMAAVSGFLLALAVSACIAAVILRAFLLDIPAGGKPKLSDVKKWCSYALPFAFQSLQQFVSSGLGIDILLVGLLTTMSASGIYAAAFRVIPVLTLVRSGLDYAFGPKVSVLFGRGDLSSIDVLYKASSTLALAFTLPFGIVFILFSRPLMTALFGTAYGEGAAALAWLVCGCVIDSATGCNITLLAMVGRSWLVLANGLLGGVLTVVFCLLLIPHFGINGGALSVLAARSCTNALATVELWRLQHLQPFGPDILRVLWPALIALIAGVAIRIHPLLPNLQPVAELAFATTLIMVTYVIALRYAGISWSLIARSDNAVS